MAVPSLSLLVCLVCLFGSIYCQLPDNVERVCREKEADVFFVLDSSSSIYVEDFNRARNFMREFITRLDISPRYTRVGALMFSDNYQVAMNLDAFSNKQSMLNAINDRSVRYLTGLTNTADAIRYVRQDPQFRQDILKVMVVVTDGNSRDQRATQVEAELAKKAGFYIFVVGIGQYRDEREWRTVASDPDDTFVTTVTEFRDLDTVARDMPARMCPLPPIILSGRVCEVSQPTDLYLVAGSSAADRAVGMITTMTENLEGNPDTLRLNLFTSTCTGTIDLPLQDPAGFCGGFPAPGNDLPDQIKRMRTAWENRPRRSANQVVVLFLDNASMQQPELTTIYQEASAIRRATGVKVYIVDMGVNDFRNYLPAMATNTETVISARTTNMRLADAFLEKACLDLNQLVLPAPQ